MPRQFETLTCTVPYARPPLLFVMHAVIVTVTVAVVISAQGLLPKPGTKHFSSFFELIAFI